MRVLFTSTPGAGHLGPLFPFAHALRRAGHEVLLAAPVSAQARVERAGLAYLSFADPLERHLVPHWEAVRAADPEEANEIVLGQIFGGRPRPRGTVRDRARHGRVAARRRAARELRVRRRGRRRGARDPARAGRRRARAHRGRSPSAPPRRCSTSCARGPGSSLTRRASASPPRPTSRSRPPRFEAPGGPLPERVLRFHDAAARPHAAPDPDAPPLVYVTFGSVAADARLLPAVLPLRARRARRTCRSAS